MENKFRGKTENGDWIYGGVAYYHSIASNRAYIVDEHLNLIPVKPDTVGQFTNYTDCNDSQLLMSEDTSLSIPLPVFTGREIQSLSLSRRSDIVG